MKEKELSVAVIMTDGRHMLACLPVNRTDSDGHYDLPKGHWEQGESLQDTAIREVMEETGYHITHPESLVDLGRHKYIPTKDLHVFLYAVDVLPSAEELECVSFFTLKGERVPEVVGYRHVSIDKLSWFFPSLQPVIATALSTFFVDIEPNFIEPATVEYN